MLPLRIEMVMPDCKVNDPAKLEYSDWRPVGDRLYPFVERFSMDGAAGVTLYDSIERGVAVEGKRFETPAEIAALAAKLAADPEAATTQASMQVVECAEQAVASIRTPIRSDQIHRSLALLLPEVMACLTDAGASAAGPPFARFHAEKEGEIDFEAGVPVAAPIAPNGRVKPSTLPGGRAAIAWHSGPYSGIAEARARLAAAVAAKPLAPRGGEWVFYWSDPTLERDPKRRRTQIVQPVQ
jgi:effector-binding domain-containing protein